MVYIMIPCYCLHCVVNTPPPPASRLWQMYINVALATNSAVDSSRRGELNGLAMTVISLTKAAAPFTCSTIFAWSLGHCRHFPFDSHLVFILLALGMLAVAMIGWETISLGDLNKVGETPRSESLETRGFDTNVIKAALSPLQTGKNDAVSETRSPRDERQSLVFGMQPPHTYNT